METDAINDLVLAFGVTLLRLTGVMLALPVLAFEVAPVRARAFVAFVLAAGLAGARPRMLITEPLLQTCMADFFWGLLVGFSLRCVLAAGELAGEIIGMEMGLGFDRAIVPFTSDEGDSVTRLLGYVGGLLVFVTGAHHHVLRALAWDIPPLYQYRGATTQAWAEAVAEMVGNIFWTGFQMAVPVAAVLFCTKIAFALVSRVAPQLNVWALGFLMTIGVGLVALPVFFPSFCRDWAELMHTRAGVLAQAAGP